MFNLNPTSLNSFILKFNPHLPVSRSRTHSHSLWIIFCGANRGPDHSFLIFFQFWHLFVGYLLHCAASVWKQTTETAAAPSYQDTSTACAEPVHSPRREDEASSNLDVSQAQDNHAKQDRSKPC